MTTSQTAPFLSPQRRTFKDLVQQRSWMWLGALLLLFPAFYNGFPILNPDDNTYLLSGINLETPFDRPITYGLLLRLLSFNTTLLWAALVSQAFWVSSVLFSLCRLLVPTLKERTIFGILLVLCGTTALAWEASQLMADIYTAITFFTWVLILWGNRPRLWHYLLFFLSAATHASHIHMFAGLSVVVLVGYRQFFPPALRRAGLQRLGICFGLLLTTILTMGSALSKSKHVFFVASMHNRDVLKPYLDAACPTQHFELCAYKDSLGPNGDYFLWNPASPLYRQGGGWGARKEDFSRIIRGSFEAPLFRRMQAITILQATGWQLVHYDVPSYNRAFQPGEELYRTIFNHYPAERALLANARQQKGTLSPLGDFWSRIQRWSIPIAAGAIALLWVFFRRKISLQLHAFLVLSLFLIGFNALVCGAFSTINGRFGARVMWLLPMGAMLVGAGGSRRVNF